MYDNNVFAVLTAFDGKNKANSAFKLSENSTWFRPSGGGVAITPTIESRQATPAEDEDSDEEELSVVDRLVVTFDKLFENENFENGIQLGTNLRSSHILLGHRGTKGVSAKQCNITVDDNLCIWLHDYHSAHGSAVGHNGQNQNEVRRNETWILAFEPGEESPFGEITIHSGSLAVEIKFVNHTTADPQYLENLRTFVKKCKGAVQKSRKDLPTVSGLDLSNEPSTEAPTDPQTINDMPIYFHDSLLGKGAFGEVHKVIRIRDGKLLAAKTFRPPVTVKKTTELEEKPVNNKRKLDKITDSAWLIGIRREFTLMKENPHTNVMQVYEFREVPEPMIIMTYYPDGNMVDALVVDDKRCISAMGQILDGLSHLHTKGLAHRDLKPENFLVKYRPFQIVITDFGLSKFVPDTTLLQTFCGTLKYAAPEVFPGLSDGHGPKVDVWSLGVIALEWIHGLPTLPDSPQPRRKQKTIMTSQWYDWVADWTRLLLTRLKNEDEGQLIEILLHMIEVNARKRWPANKCLTLGFENGLFKRRRVDGLVVCMDDSYDPIVPADEENEGTQTPTAASPSVWASLSQSLASIDPEATIILENMWDGDGPSSPS